ncbi:L-serine ammonia-lyase [Arboricoccus pini]|uniref:L-serine dehydratase n=1 Tax=Arboricoccus pini TaxID=1963835 RepID=A0A212R994_9PROT|nr:L-serine ammonia-lyase [Arboricoccus pini]SNB68623.1 L-serine ammonia-lyase [Arboricoccus pini]
MTFGVFDIFKIGIGPSSSHTVGPMKAAMAFVRRLEERAVLGDVARVKVELFGSLALTGLGHGTDRAILLGLMGEAPDLVDPDSVDCKVAAVHERNSIALLGSRLIPFERPDLDFRMSETLPGHPNGMRFFAYAQDGGIIDERIYYSVGGGFVLAEEELHGNAPAPEQAPLPFDFHTGNELVAMAEANGLSIAALMRANERTRHDDTAINAGLDRIWTTMEACVAHGLVTDGILPGGLKVKRRAAALHRELKAKAEMSFRDALAVMDWISLYAIAVNEENAAGGRVVTAPTNGAAGIVPAVLHYYDRFCHGATRDGVRDFLLTAAAIGTLYKRNASISGAEVGCQGEVGVACSMAAAGLAAAWGATPSQIENAAEIGMEHNLGLTCDPIGGLVQIPCIERNAIGATKAINAARLAIRGDGTHFVSLDKVIKTMRETGADMASKYKETSLGGLAVNVVEC